MAIHYSAAADNRGADNDIMMTGLLSDFHFLRPLWLLAILPAVLLCITLWRSRTGSNQWSQVIAARFLPFLLDGQSERQKRWPLLGVFALWIIATVAVAGPVWQKIPQPVEQASSPVVIAWDLSPSMLAEDVKPSRLVRSRLKIIDLLKARKDGQTGLIAYSGEAYTVTPITDDQRTIINLLPALNPGMLPTVGSNPEMAFEQAETLLREAGATTGHIIFVTDEIDSGAFAYLETLARKSLYRFTIWGVGTTEGAPIPLPNGGFAKDSAGNMVVPKLNEAALSRFAAQAGGWYVPLTTADTDVDTIIRLLDNRAPVTQTTLRVFDQWYEQGHWLALALLPFLALLFRRGFIFSLLLIMPFALHNPAAHAFSWDDLWLKQDQQAERDLAAGDAEAAGRFTTPDRRGAAYFQLQEYGKSAEEFALSTAPSGAYNLGTALTRAGSYEQAIAAFDRALQTDPDAQSPRHNREIARKLLELSRQQEQESDQKQDGEQDDSDQQQEGSPDSTSEDNQSGQQESGDSDGGTENATSDSQQPQNAEQPDASAEDSNPYSDAADAMNGEEPPQEPASAQPDAGDTEDTGSRTDAAALAETDELSDEQQMLEQMLRKVPDDPSGLLRNKFRYQYLQRKQTLQQQSPFSDNDAEKRW